MSTHETPPETPPETPNGEKKGLSTAAKLAIGCAAVFLIGTIASVGGAMLILVPRVEAQQQKTQCADRLRQLGAIVTAETINDGPPTVGGAPLFLSYRSKYYIQRGQEQVLTCPGDPVVVAPGFEVSEFWDSLDFDDPQVVRAHCSYAVRDFVNFPVEDAHGYAIVLACDAPGNDGAVRSHRDGLNILYNDGSVMFRDREYFGLGPDEPITIGPDSPIEELRPLVVMPAR